LYEFLYITLDLKMIDPKAIILCDFDGTIATKDVFDEILNAFGESPYGATGTAFDEGKISHRQMNERFVQSLSCSPVHLESFLKENIRMREGFFDFCASLTKSHVGFAVISGGWDIYIKYLLKNCNPSFVENLQEIAAAVLDKNCIAIACNRITHDGQSYSFVSHALENEQCAPNKALIATHLRSEYQVPIISIGDGDSDYEMAKISDFVFATGKLVDFCSAQGISFLPFTNFREISEGLPIIVSKLTPPEGDFSLRTNARILQF
jgi:2-hydroxy-3-keto-5-methylthiopentenyl-1-phosphate phosphatase